MSVMQTAVCAALGYSFFNALVYLPFVMCIHHMPLWAVCALNYYMPQLQHVQSVLVASAARVLLLFVSQCY